MLYDVSVNVHIGSINKTIDAENEDEANKIASLMGEERLREVAPAIAEVRAYARLSDENFKYHKGSIYLVQWYRHLVPARCIHSDRTYRYSYRFEHRFELLGKDRTIELKVKDDNRHPKVGAELCNDGKIGKDACSSCPAKFACYTIKEK